MMENYFKKTDKNKQYRFNYQYFTVISNSAELKLFLLNESELLFGESDAQKNGKIYDMCFCS